MTEIKDISAMLDQGWKDRLAAAINESGKSKRAISLAAGMGPGYVHSVLVEGKDPTIENLAKICDHAGVSLSFVIFGYDLHKEDEDLLVVLRSLPKDAKEGLLKALKAGQKEIQ